MPEKYPKISIVTVSFNQGTYIEHCIRSILDQKYPNLEYIIIDGGSTDNTIEIIKKYESQISYWVSEKDNGIYDALQTGFEKTTGEIMGWLNSDDMLIQNSLFTLAGIFSNNPKIEWIQGNPCVADASGRIVYQRAQRFSKYSFYLKLYHDDGIFIQQESSYWRRSLWEKAGGYISNNYKFAGDFELWIRFYKYAVQYTTTALIGAFRMRNDKNQISSKHYSDYLIECDQIIDSSSKELNYKDQSILQEMKKEKKRKGKRSLMKELGYSKNLKFWDPKYSVEFDFETQTFSKLIKT
jgi:glycosyltransferase involved in cell wall biosynthesis